MVGVGQPDLIKIQQAPTVLRDHDFQRFQNIFVKTPILFKLRMTQQVIVHYAKSVATVFVSVYPLQKLQGVQKISAPVLVLDENGK